MKTRALVLSLAAWLCFSSSSSAEQQYAVGDVGPNGGIVTDVTFESVLSNTTEAVVGDFLEITETYTNTETVIERIDEVVIDTVIETVATEVKTEATTPNTVTLGDFGNPSGGVSINSSFIRFDYRGGTASASVALEDYMTRTEINGGFTATGSADVMTCLNTIGTNTSCSDIGDPTADAFSITITVSDGVTSYTNTTNHIIDWDPSAYRTVFGSLSVPENGLVDPTATIMLYGQDVGFWGGFYGPTAINPSLSFTYDQVQVVLAQIEREVERTVTSYVQTILTSESYVFDEVYVGNPALDTTVPTAPVASFDEPVTVTIDALDHDSMVATVQFESPSTGEMVTETIEIDVTEMSIEPLDGEMTEFASATDGDAGGEVSEGGPEGGSSEASSEEGEEDSNGGGGSRPNNSRGQSGASAAQAYSVVMDAVRVAVMARSEASAGFAQYQQQSIPSVEFYAPAAMEGGNTYDNPMGMWYSGASDALWNNMVEMQYGN